METRVEIPLCEYENERERHRDTSPGADSLPFDTVLSACLDPAIDDGASPVAGAIARLTGARLVAACALPAGAGAKAIVRMAREEPADLVALAAPDLRGSERIPDLARALLDDGVAVLVVPAGDHRSWRPARIGLGYDGSPPADAALAIASRLLEAGRGEDGLLDIAYVDDSAAASYESEGEVIASRRGAVIEWWLDDLVEPLPARVRPLRLIGDPTVELAELSDDLDLLVIGTRGRASLRRVFTGSVSRGLIARTRCPLLVVPPRPADRERQTPTRAAARAVATREI
jgi:nucleotide-binding universal stress UspA family protein